MTTDTTDIAVRSETAITRADPEQASAALAHVLGSGDLSKLTNQERVHHYLNLCSSLGLNPLSRPFQWIEFQEKENSPAVLTLYFKPAGAAQMLRNHQVSVRYVRKEIVGELFVCEAEGMAPNGRKGQATKYVPLTGKYGKLTGRLLANAFMSAETGALRRLALNMFGLSTGPDLDDAFSVRTVVIDGSGRIIEQPTDEQKALYDDPRLAKTIGEPTYETTGDASESPLAGTASQAPRIEELTPPTRPYQPPARFHCDVEKWRSTWFMVARDTFLDSDDARHGFLAWWTSSWPENRRTDSLGTFLEHATDRQAEALINAAREVIAEEAEALAHDSEGELDGIDGVTPEQGRQIAVEQRGQDDHPAIDAPAQAEAFTIPERPDPDADYTRPQVLGMWASWANAMKRLGGIYQMPDVPKLKTPALAAELGKLIVYTEGLAVRAGEQEEGPSESIDESAAELPF